MFHAALSRVLAGAAALSVLYQSGGRMDELSMMAAVFSSAGLLVHYAADAFGAVAEDDDSRRRRRRARRLAAVLAVVLGALVGCEFYHASGVVVAAIALALYAAVCALVLVVMLLRPRCSHGADIP